MLTKNILDFFGYVFTSKNGENVLNIVKWIQNNVNAVLVIMILLILLYVGYLKRKKRKYSIEAIWAEEEVNRVRNVANIQKELEEILLEFRGIIYNNMTLIQEQIRFFTDEDSIKTDYMIEYKSNTEKIKELLCQIVNVEGIQIYAQRNRHMYTQLVLLEILPLLSDKTIFINIDKVSKSYIAKNCKTAKDLCESYSYGVSFINGINRFLRFSYKKRRQYNKIALHIADADYLGGIAEKMK